MERKTDPRDIHRPGPVVQRFDEIALLEHDWTAEHCKSVGPQI